MTKVFLYSIEAIANTECTKMLFAFGIDAACHAPQRQPDSHFDHAEHLLLAHVAIKSHVTYADSHSDVIHCKSHVTDAANLCFSRQMLKCSFLADAAHLS